MSDGEDRESDEAEDESQQQGGGEAGPPEDIENDPAYDPDDENLKGIKGG
jgi:hypothetical protein